jgi:uncharacterized membrane protein YidH (DUF202 family)
MAESAIPPPEASRRTRFAEERTLLAWWRTGIAAAAVALAVGGIVPKLSGLPKDRFVALGVGYGILAIAFFVGGAIRGRLSRDALERNTFAEVPDWVVITMAAYMSALIVLTVIAFF